MNLLSVIMPACNQRDEARLTLHSARQSLRGVPHEFIVVDDNCLDGSTHGMPNDVLIVRNRGRKGVSRSRRHGVKRSGGDVLLFIDSHCRFPGDSLARLLARVREGVLVQSACRITANSAVRYGGRWRSSPRGLQCILSQEIVEHQTLYGTTYALTRKTYDSIGGWPELPKVYGASETAMSLLCWYADVPVETQKDIVCVHKGRLARKLHWTKDYALTEDDHGTNVKFVHRAFFPETYDMMWRDRLGRSYGEGDPREFGSKMFKRLTKQIERVRKHGERDFYRDVLHKEV